MKINKKITVIILTVFIITTLVSIIPTNVFANNSAEFSSNHDDQLKELFRFTLDDAIDPLKWIRKRETFLIIEKRVDGGVTAWINAPNFQSMTYAVVEEKLPNGYEDTVTDLDTQTKNSLFPTDSNGNTGLKKWGFSLPSNIYYGEWPSIKLNPSAMFPTSGFWSGFKTIIKLTTGGSLLNEVSKDNFNTLYYAGVHDYIDDYSYVKWIENNWNSTCDYIKSEGEEEYPLLSKSYCGNNYGEFDGIYYTYEACIKDQGLESVEGTAEEFNQTLKSRFGPHYYEIMFNMIAIGPDISENNYDDLTRYPLRVMPYEKETLIDEFDLVDDPRAQVSKTPIIEMFHYNIMNLFKTDFAVSFVGLISSLSLKLNQLCSLDSISGVIDINILNKNTFVTTMLIALVSLIAVIKIASETFKLTINKQTGIKTFFVGISTFIVGALITGLISNYDAFTSTFDTMINFGEDLVAEIFDNGTSISEFADSSATEDDLYDMTFWMPYLNTWFLYNTTHTIEGNKIDWNSDPELEEANKNKMLPKIGSKTPEFWGCVLIKGFTESENEVSNDIYRVVDHFMAPRISVDTGGISVSSTMNENYEGMFQESSGGGIVYVLFILVITILRLILFWSIIYNFIFLYAYFIKEFAIADRGIKGVANEAGIFFKSIGVYTAITLMQGIICYYASISDNNLSTIIANVILFTIFTVVAFMLTFSKNTAPKLICSIRDFLGV